MPDSLSYAPVLEGRTLLDELNHRIKNELVSVINLVTFKAVWSDNVEVKEALGNVVDLLHQHVAPTAGDGCSCEPASTDSSPAQLSKLFAGVEERVAIQRGQDAVNRIRYRWNRSDAGGSHWPSTNW